MVSFLFSVRLVKIKKLDQNHNPKTRKEPISFYENRNQPKIVSD